MSAPTGPAKNVTALALIEPPSPRGQRALLAYSDIFAILAELEPGDRVRVVDALNAVRNFGTALIRGKS